MVYYTGWNRSVYVTLRRDAFVCGILGFTHSTVIWMSTKSLDLVWFYLTVFLLRNKLYWSKSLEKVGIPRSVMLRLKLRNESKVF